jgi:hypothetical protein
MTATRTTATTRSISGLNNTPKKLPASGIGSAEGAKELMGRRNAAALGALLVRALSMGIE